MEKYFSYVGTHSLEEAKQNNTVNIIFHLSSREIAIKRCDRTWKDKEYSLYTFENFQNNSTFTKII